MHKEKRGLRFEFSADAELCSEDSSTSTRGRAKELSLRGCFVEVSGAFAEHQRIRVKIPNAGECFECWADVIYVRPTGVGLLFVDLAPAARDVLQKWVLTALDRQAEEIPSR
jgi:hypothetical protein